MHDSLLTREGPLAQVWLAANLERKLNKAQFLQSNITQSTQAIVRATTNSDESPEALTLRLSGQLLYGVVRIYSRKAKYLLDDVSDALLKLKSAFKSSAHTVTLPVNATIVPSMKHIVLQDTITHSDLLYQEPLTFDDEPQQREFNFFGTQGHNSMDADESIELPRNKFGDEVDALHEDDGLDIDLNFDLDQDQGHDDFGGFDDMGDNDMDFDLSVEEGRAADDPNMSSVMNNSLPEINLGSLNQPLETIEDDEERVTEQSQPKKRKQRRPVLGRSIITDNETELNIRTFSNTEGIVTSGERLHELDLSSKRSLVEDLLNKTYLNNGIAEQFFTIKNNKRQKTRPSSPVNELPELQSDHENESVDHGDRFEDNGYDGMDMDFNVDEIRDDDPLEEDIGALDAEAENLTQGFNSGVTESTSKVDKHVTELLQSLHETTFTDVIEKDLVSEEPLAAAPKSEATRVFFELLVLATGDKIKVQQHELFGEISITL